MAKEKIYDSLGNGLDIAEMLARGGEAEIYPVIPPQNKPFKKDVLFKKYHADVLIKRGSNIEKKIDAMRKISALREDEHLAWPLIPIFDNSKNWSGYCMYKGNGVVMFKLAHASLYKKYFPNLDRLKIVSYLINFLKEIKKLHKHNIMVGDYNLNNILINPDSDQVTLIDCDSYQIYIDGQHFPCEVGSADLTPKEHQNMPFRNVIRTHESEYFSVAIILFKTLMIGRHPYDIVGGTDPVQNLCMGKFPYGTDGRGIPRGQWYNIWSHMPYKVKSLFIQTFSEGATDPAKRATIDDWLRELKGYYKEMQKGWHEVAIIPSKPKEKIYKGNSNV